MSYTHSLDSSADLTAQRPLVVLGASVKGTRPSAVLEARLAEAARRAPDVAARGDVIVVSGYGEAPVMDDWLVQHGVDPDLVIREPDARSTNENLENTRALLADLSDLPVERYDIVTNWFHAPRVHLWAWYLGYPIHIHCAPTPKAAIPKAVVRESGALIHSALRIAWRRIKPLLASPPYQHR